MEMRTVTQMLRASLLMALALAAALTAHNVVGQGLMSQNFIKPGEETLTINVGGILNQFDTSLQVNGSTHNGTVFNLENNGLSDNLTSFDISGTWRIASRHRIDLQYFSTKRSGTRRYDSQVVIGDNVFP